MNQGTYNKSLSLYYKTCAYTIDVGLVLIVGAWLLKLIHIAPVPGLSFFGVFFLSAGIYWIPQKAFANTTVGERLSRLEINETPFFKANRLSKLTVFLGSLAATISSLVAISVLSENVLRHPYWIQASKWNLNPISAPPADTFVAPIFYTVSNWPSIFNNQPIFYSLEYKKGPPSHFISQIVAHWSDPEINVTLEGPKTPKNIGNQSRIKNCFANRFSSSCLVVRETILSRHLEEIQNFFQGRNPEKWDLRWFNVENPNFPPEEQAQGIYLSATLENRIQDRFILVNLDGIQQTLVLNRLSNQQGDLALEQMLQTLRGMRLYNELNTARTWINLLLESTQLDALKSIKDKQILYSKLSEIQGLLVSRISLYPQEIDSYFHLAGVSLLILKNKFDSEKDSNTQRKIPIQASVFQKNIESAYRYVSDISPDDSRIQQIFSIWQESQRFRN